MFNFLKKKTATATTPTVCWHLDEERIDISLPVSIDLLGAPGSKHESVIQYANYPDFIRYCHDCGTMKITSGGGFNVATGGYNTWRVKK